MDGTRTNSLSYLFFISIWLTTAFINFSLFARRDPIFVFVFDESLFAFTYATPPFVFALLFERLTTREPLPVSA